MLRQRHRSVGRQPGPRLHAVDDEQQRLACGLGRLDRHAHRPQVIGLLRAMTDGGQLTNEQAGNPRGYGLPEWDGGDR